MTDEQTSGSKKKGKRMVVKTVRLTEESHQLVSTLADLLDVPISEAVERAIKSAYPDAVEEAQRREEKKQQVKDKK